MLSPSFGGFVDDFNISNILIPVPDHRGLTWVGDHVLPLLGLLAPRGVPV